MRHVPAEPPAGGAQVRGEGVEEQLPGVPGGHPHLQDPVPDPALQPPHTQDLLRRHALQRALRLPGVRYLDDPDAGDLEDLRQGDRGHPDAGGVRRAVRADTVQGLLPALPSYLSYTR